MKLHRILAKAFGYELIKRKNHPSPNSHITNLINRYEIDLILDVGANHGQFGKMLRKEGYKGDIHSFEPVSTTFELLSHICRNDKRWFAHKIAMGETCGQNTVNIMEASDFSSFLDPNDFGKNEFKEMNVTHSETVEVETIDTFLTTQIKNHMNRRIFLKMDTQGYDLKVFKGASKTTPFIKCVLSEISLIPIYSGMPHYLSSLKKYEDCGFSITGLYPVNRRKDLSVIEMDCMLINRNNE